MNYYLSKIGEALWGTTDDARVKLCESRLDVLENQLKNLLNGSNGKEYDDLSVFTCDEDDDLSCDEKVNFGVKIKSLGDNSTQLQYISGNGPSYKMLNRIYSDMDGLLDIRVASPRDVIQNIDRMLTIAGYDINHLSDESKIVNAQERDVGNVIKEWLVTI
ncbi:p38.7 [Clostera anastomosis granulovirus A]|uniref:P38.7 n=1 Tax=Clostera anastomosis granulovirus A TaxID=1986289 RepID=U5KBA0_9BBAC|nr:p38.7 [Clostera anastomosis granulovirus Henan]AGQ20320.1 p38.7 [Clostera anastomosis granulovirus Henan]